jgi:hypothetical protein
MARSVNRILGLDGLFTFMFLGLELNLCIYIKGGLPTLKTDKLTAICEPIA